MDDEIIENVSLTASYSVSITLPHKYAFAIICNSNPDIPKEQKVLNRSLVSLPLPPMLAFSRTHFVPRKI